MFPTGKESPHPQNGGGRCCLCLRAIMDVLQKKGNVFRETSIYLASYTASEAENTSLLVYRLTTSDIYSTRNPVFGRGHFPFSCHDSGPRRNRRLSLVTSVEVFPQGTLGCYLSQPLTLRGRSMSMHQVVVFVVSPL
jgi:hypothetical protein